MKKKLLSVVISMITVFSLCILPVSAMRPDSDRVHDGIDVSEFQGDIDFDRVHECGIEVVYIRAGSGDIQIRILNPKLERHVNRM